MVYLECYRYKNFQKSKRRFCWGTVHFQIILCSVDSHHTISASCGQYQVCSAPGFHCHCVLSQPLTPAPMKHLLWLWQLWCTPLHEARMKYTDLLEIFFTILRLRLCCCKLVGEKREKSKVQMMTKGQLELLTKESLDLVFRLLNPTSRRAMFSEITFRYFSYFNIQFQSKVCMEPRVSNLFRLAFAITNSFHSELTRNPPRLIITLFKPWKSFGWK